jgi:hypothetical protein
MNTTQPDPAQRSGPSPVEQTIANCVDSWMYEYAHALAVYARLVADGDVDPFAAEADPEAFRAAYPAELDVADLSEPEVAIHGLRAIAEGLYQDADDLSYLGFSDDVCAIGLYPENLDPRITFRDLRHAFRGDRVAAARAVLRAFDSSVTRVQDFDRAAFRIAIDALTAAEAAAIGAALGTCEHDLTPTERLRLAAWRAEHDVSRLADRIVAEYTRRLRAFRGADLEQAVQEMKHEYSVGELVYEALEYANDMCLLHPPTGDASLGEDVPGLYNEIHTRLMRWTAEVTVEALHQALEADIAEAVLDLQQEIVEHARDGSLYSPGDITEYSDLHAYLDANTLAGFSDPLDADHPSGRAHWPTAALTQVQERVDTWVRQGGLRAAVPAPVANEEAAAADGP